MIVSVVNQKGGSGKSTISTNLACLFASRGKEVFLIDADPEQHTALNWLSERPDNVPVIHGASLPAKNLIRESASLKSKYEVIICDGGARITEHAFASVAVADLIVIPCRPSKADLDSSANFIDVVRGDMDRRPELKGAILLNQVQPKTNVASVTRDYLEDWNFAVFNTIVGHRVDFIEALWAGQGVTEYAPGSAAASEIIKFYEEIQEVLRGE